LKLQQQEAAHESEAQKTADCAFLSCRFLGYKLICQRW
jgi:hypothetical protein